MEKVTRLLISYHSNDGRWKDVLSRHCEPYQKKGELEVLYDEISGRGEHLNSLYDESTASFDVCLFIISKDYLALSMVENGNIETLISSFDRHGAKVVLVYAEDCEWQKYEWIIEKGLWPHQSLALSHIKNDPISLKKRVSKLIRDVMSVERDTDRNKPSNEQSERKSDELEAEKKIKDMWRNNRPQDPTSDDMFFFYGKLRDEYPELTVFQNSSDPWQHIHSLLLEEEKKTKGGAYGEGKYGEGVYGVSDHFREEDWQKDFIRFLTEDKGWTEMIYGADGPLLLYLSFKNPHSQKEIAVIDFKEKINRKIESKAKASFAQFAELELGKFLVTPSSEESNYSFVIYKYSDRGLVRMQPSDFPAYKDIFGEESADGIGQTIDNVNIKSHHLVMAFRKFLKEEKHVPDSALKPRRGTFKITRNITLSPLAIEGEDGSKLAMIDFSPAMDGRGISNSNKRIREHLVDSKLENCAAYIVCQAKYQKEYPFEIFRVAEYDKPELISYENFPTYDQLLFEWPLSESGRRICRNLIEHARDKHGLSVHVPCQDYIDLQIKKNNRTAAQIHRLNESDDNVALVLAGYQEKFPLDLRFEYLSRGEIGQLSGYTNKYPGERNWLDGKLGRQHLKYPASVIILKPGVLVLEEIEAEIGGLLKLAKSNAENKGALEPESEIVVGDVATIRVECVGEKDCLGRDKLVKTLAGMFARTECDNGFTMALLGDWGQGKSTVMGLLQTELSKQHKNDFEFATYNAWEYEKTENVPAGIAQEVVKGLTENTGKWEKLLLRFRFGWREHNEKLRRLVTAVSAFMILVVISLGIALVVREMPSWYKYIPPALGLGAISLPIVNFKDLKRIFEHPLSTQLQTYLKLPDYGEHLGLIPVLKRHIETLCEFRLNGKKKLVVFVDDLDRCNVDHIAKVLDAIRLVMTIPNVIVMIGIDHRIAFKAIRKHYKELADNGDLRGAGEIARDYLGKIIQLPLRLRAATHEELKEYVFEKLFDPQNIIDDTESKVSTERDGEGSVPGQAEPAGELAVDAGGDTEGQEADNGVENTAGGIEATEKVISEAIKDKKSELKAFYKLVGDYKFSNPRQLLRLHNSFRFLKGYSRVTGVGYSTLEILRMLFWQEFLHNWPMKLRGGCMAALSGVLDVEKLDSRVRVVMNNVKADIVKLFEQPTSYQELADFVRMVVLPHNEEGVLDSAEEIREWLKEEKEYEESDELDIEENE